MPRLFDYAVKQAEGLPGRLDDIEGVEVTVNEVRFNSGTYGPYCVLSVVLPEGELLDIMTSAFLVLNALENAEREKGLPCIAKFSRKGRTWIVE